MAGPSPGPGPLVSANQTGPLQNVFFYLPNSSQHHHQAAAVGGLAGNSSNQFASEMFQNSQHNNGTPFNHISYTQTSHNNR